MGGACFVDPPGADPHAVVVWGGCPATGIVTQFRRLYSGTRYEYTSGDSLVGNNHDLGF
jgi:hypothetical protein